MIRLSGIYPPVVTPFENQQVSYSGLSHNLKKWNEYSLAGYVLLGSNGENVMLDETEALNVIDTAVKYLPEDKQMIIGAGKESVRQTLKFMKQAEKIGGNAFLVISPHYYRDQMTDAALLDYYSEIADNSSLPVIIYHVPKFTGLTLTPGLLAKLSEHPNIIGMKDSSGNITCFQTLLSLQLPDFQLLTGSANTLYTSLMMGAAGGVLALANIAPQLCIDIYQYVQLGQHTSARDLQLKLIALNQLTTSRHGIGGLKYALDQLGYMGGEPRRPLAVPDDTGKKQIMMELKKVSLL